ncbi:MAG: hypothetical protein AB7S26_41715 [Sandaracinaceae bacterium]
MSELSLVDPVTKTTLRLATAEELEKIRAHGAPAGTEAAYVTPDRKAAYAVVDGIANLLPEARIDLG